jgi:CMP-N-acetylneuraminic acid synthetase
MSSRSVVALIPARGGSKRLPRKNVKLFAGAPLLVHSISLAKALPSLHRVLVSTDDAETAEIARSAGAEVVIRPPGLSHDRATTASAVKHALGVAYAGQDLPLAVVTLQPNCPLRSPALVTRAIEIFVERKPDSVVSVTESHHKLGVIEGGYFRPSYRTGTRSQDLEPQYFENGVVYVSRAEMVAVREDLFGEHIVPLITDPLFALGDIDTALDFQVAEFLFQAHKGRFEPRAVLHEEHA